MYKSQVLGQEPTGASPCNPTLCGGVYQDNCLGVRELRLINTKEESF